MPPSQGSPESHAAVWALLILSLCSRFWGRAWNPTCCTFSPAHRREYSVSVWGMKQCIKLANLFQNDRRWNWIFKKIYWQFILNARIYFIKPANYSLSNSSFKKAGEQETTRTNSAACRHCCKVYFLKFAPPRTLVLHQFLYTAARHTPIKFQPGRKRSHTHLPRAMSFPEKCWLMFKNSVVSRVSGYVGIDLWSFIVVVIVMRVQGRGVLWFLPVSSSMTWPRTAPVLCAGVKGSSHI